MRHIAHLFSPLSLRYNSFKQSLKHWKNACQRETPPAAERQRHFSQRLALRVVRSEERRVGKEC